MKSVGVILRLHPIVKSPLNPFHWKFQILWLRNFSNLKSCIFQRVTQDDKESNKLFYLPFLSFCSIFKSLSLCSEANDAREPRPAKWDERRSRTKLCKHQQHPPVRDPHEAAQEEELPAGLAQQVPLEGQKDRRAGKSDFPRHLRFLQHVLLDFLPYTRGQHGCKMNIESYHFIRNQCVFYQKRRIHVRINFEADYA